MRYVNLLVGANEELVILESMVKVLPLSEYSWITYGLVGFEYEAE